ncbi:MAG: AI-2E family transporter [Candidatus Altiarchaeota archaeon]
MATQWFTKNLHWTLFGLLLLYLIFLMVYPYLDVFVYALFIYYVTRPIYLQLKRECNHDSLSAFIAVFMFILPVILLVIYTFSVASIELQYFLGKMDSPEAKALNSALQSYHEFALDFNPKILIEAFMGNEDIRSIIYYLLSSSLDIILNFVLVFLIGFYLLKDGPKVTSWFKKTCCENRLWLRVFLDEVDGGLFHVFFGNILTAGLTAVIAATSFVFLNSYSPSEFLQIPYPVLLGMLAGIASLIPLLGLKLVWVPLFLWLSLRVYVYGNFAAHWPFLLFFLFVVNVIVDIIPDLILRPYISGRNIHLGIMMLSYIFGPAAFGPVGIFVGPLIVIVSTNFGKIVLPQIISRK